MLKLKEMWERANASMRGMALFGRSCPVSDPMKRGLRNVELRFT